MCFNIKSAFISLREILQFVVRGILQKSFLLIQFLGSNTLEELLPISVSLSAYCIQNKTELEL
jgi:hypothetical protein